MAMTNCLNCRRVCSFRRHFKPHNLRSSYYKTFIQFKPSVLSVQVYRNSGPDGIRISFPVTAGNGAIQVGIYKNLNEMLYVIF